MTNDTRCRIAPEPIEALPREQAPALDLEAGRAAVQAWLDAIQYLSPRDAVLLACLAYQRHLQERHRALYACANGQRLPGVHPCAVRDALSTLSYYWGEFRPIPEDAMARALAAARASDARRDADERAHERRHAEASRETAAVCEQARRRARAWRSAAEDVL